MWQELYQQLIIDHASQPRNFSKPTEFTYSAIGHNQMCGDKIEVFACQCSKTKVINKINFTGEGCAICMASASIMTELANNKPIENIVAIKNNLQQYLTSSDNIETMQVEPGMEKLQVLIGVKQFPARVKCATLAWHTVSAALANKNIATTE